MLYETLNPLAASVLDNTYSTYREKHYFARQHKSGSEKNVKGIKSHKLFLGMFSTGLQRKGCDPHLKTGNYSSVV